MNRYIRELRQGTAERLAAAAAIRAHAARPLDQKIQEWFAALPPEERRAQYKMSELVLIFNVASSRIGTALHRLGWQRRRSWREGASYSRFWVPAQIN
jgi:hypothetical protein